MMENKKIKNIFLFLLLNYGSVIVCQSEFKIEPLDSFKKEILNERLGQKCIGHPDCNIVYKPIKLEDIFNIAKLHRQDLKGMNYLIDSNWHAERAALGKFLPQFSISADSGKSSKEELSGISQYPKASIQFEYNQLIFSMDGPMMQYRVAKQETLISKAQKVSLENSIRINSETKFLDLKKEILRKELMDALYKSSNMTFDQSKTRKVAGFFNKVDWENANATYTKEQNDVRGYPWNLDIAVKLLEREANVDIFPGVISKSYEAIDSIKLKSEEDYFRIALANRPDLKEKELQIQKSEISSRQYKYKYVPEIRVITQVQKAKMVQCPPLQVGTIPFDNKPLIWHVGLNMSWNFDGLSNYNTSKQFDDLSTGYSLQKRDLELNILKDIQALKSLIETHFWDLNTAKKEYEAAKVALDRAKVQYDAGLIALYQYEQANLNYKQKEFALISLKIDIRTSYQKMLYLCGYPSEISDSAEYNEKDLNDYNKKIHENGIDKVQQLSDTEMEKMVEKCKKEYDCDNWNK